MTLSNQPEPTDRDTLIRFYESYGITFIDDGKAILNSQGGIISPIVIDEKLLLEPSAASLVDFKNQLPKELLELSEPFDPTDEKNEYIINDERHRIIDRVFDHFDWRGRRYYRYLEAVGPASVSNVDWEKIIAYLLCVAAAIGIILLLAMLPGGQVLLVHFVAIFTVIAGGCLVIIAGVGNQVKRTAYVRTYVAR
jgi:hypothetical protein